MTDGLLQQSLVQFLLNPDASGEGQHPQLPCFLPSSLFFFLAGSHLCLPLNFSPVQILHGCSASGSRAHAVGISLAGTWPCIRAGAWTTLPPPIRSSPTSHDAPSRWRTVKLHGQPPLFDFVLPSHRTTPASWTPPPRASKAGFSKEKKSFEAEKATLLKRAEDAEGQLKPITEELSGFKRHIAQMTQAIFEQLYAGSHLAIKATMGDKQPLNLIKNVLKCLSTIPQHIPELKRSAARSGVIYALIWALAYVEELDPAELAKGFPEFKNDGSEFSQEDYAAYVKDAQILSTQLVSEMKLKNYQAAYDTNHTRISSPDLISKNLAPQWRKHIFCP